MIFASALRRLTIVYSCIQLLVFAALAIGVYAFVTGTFDFDAAIQDGTSAIGAAERGFALLRIALIAGFGILCVVVPFTSYWMARAALAPLRQSYESQQQFVDDASHEFRGPLSIIRGELELATSRPRSQQEYRRSIATSLEATQSLVQLTEDLLILARNSGSELEPHFGPVGADAIVRDAVGTLTDDARARLTTRSGVSTSINGIAPLLVRALANILDNALKFSPEDGAVVLSAAETSTEVIFSVTDQGIGMTAEEARHAFDRFWRAANNSAAAGHGLGLALVERIARVHRGRVRIASTPGAGSTITLTLPVARIPTETIHN